MNIFKSFLCVIVALTATNLKSYAESDDGTIVEDICLPLDSATLEEIIPIYFSNDIPPSFPGGEDALYKFIAENLRYPKEAQENNIEGIVIVSFMVSEKGELSDFNVERGENLPLNNEAIRVAKLMPNFNPAITKYGEAIKYKYLIPVHFKLEEINQADSISSDSN